MPAFLQSSPFTAKLFRATVERLARAPPPPSRPCGNNNGRDLAALAAAWLRHEAAGARLRMAHRCIEWDGWEEGLVGSILGPEEQEEDWFKAWDADDDHDHDHDAGHDELDTHEEDERAPNESPEPSDSPVAAISVESLALSPSATSAESEDSGVAPVSGFGLGLGFGLGGKPSAQAALLPQTQTQTQKKAGAANGGVPAAPKVVVAVEKEREKLLNATGDFCGGRGGELGRRLEAWLYVNGDADGRVDLGRRWEGTEEDEE